LELLTLVLLQLELLTLVLLYSLTSRCRVWIRQKGQNFLKA